jgi:hypothetical protein
VRGTIAASLVPGGRHCGAHYTREHLAFSAWVSRKLQAAFDLNFRPSLIVTTLVMQTAVNPGNLIGLFGYMIGTFVTLAVAGVLR